MFQFEKKQACCCEFNHSCNNHIKQLIKNLAFPVENSISWTEDCLLSWKIIRDSTGVDPGFVPYEFIDEEVNTKESLQTILL
jgi:hypothetical protein